MKKIVLAGGCFWGLQHFFDQFPGVLKTEVGYANGPDAAPDYRAVCNGSGHTEAVEIEYDDAISTAQILAAFFAVIDPFSVNRQGNDIGINYRTGIYTADPLEQAIARTMIQDIEARSGKKVAVEVVRLDNFFDAEEYHQKYLDKNPGGYCHIPRGLMSGHRLPTLGEVEEAYPGLTELLEKKHPADL